MTLAAIWIETRGLANETLCFASDSRTTPGPIDGVTKVTLFGREDIAAVWAGDFRYASILMSHLDAVFTASEAMRRRDIDVASAFAQAVTTIQNHLNTSMKPSVPPFRVNTDAQAPERTTIVVGGYSTSNAVFVLLRIDWTPRDQYWDLSIKQAEPDKVMFIGDKIKSAKSNAKRARTYREQGPAGTWRMEPLSAIYHACLDPNTSTTGGDLQLAKSFMHGSARAYGFFDSFNGGAVSVRATRVDLRAVRELTAAGLVIDLSLWRLRYGVFAARRFAASAYIS